MEERAEFPAFPFKPYSIQLQLMGALYTALQKGGVAIVESPTGTGKTLSIICSVLQWLEDKRSGLFSVDESTAKDSSDEPDWMRTYSGAKPVQNKSRLKKKKNNQTHFLGEPTADELTERQNKSLKAVTAEDDQEFLLEEYDSEDATGSTTTKRKKYMASSSSGSESEEEDKEQFKVFFASRTHSQLSQFIGELRRTHFSESMNVIALGSRKNLCINHDVLKLGNASRINERCLELQNSKSKQKVVNGDKKIQKLKSTGCPFIKKQHLQKQFKEDVLQTEPLDIEDLVHLGKKHGTCPYYGSRRMIKHADVVVLPYQSLLHSTTRESLGVILKDSIVIFDEAHNLVDTVMNTYSSQVSQLQLKQVNSQLSEYLSRFKNRLAAANRRYINVLLNLIQAFLSLFAESSNDSPSTTTSQMMPINEFLFSLQIDNVNLFKLQRYIKESKIANKVSSYGEKYFLQQADVGNENYRGSTSAFHSVADFILGLTTAETDGRVLLVPQSEKVINGGGFLKLIMLDAAKHFSQILSEARSVVLAGGTLQPIAELRERLLPHINEERLHLFSCGHMVPGESILPLAIGKGPSGKTFDFTYHARSSLPMMEELGRLVVNILSIVPEGVVIFFPSFEYEEQVFKAWESNGTLTSMKKKKEIFREPRNVTALECVLQAYKASSSGGAMLMGVVGGKMSEGINFSDGMGRCVIMVGLPYPSPSDPELMERIKYVDNMGSSKNTSSTTTTTTTVNGVSVLQQCGLKGREYYENLCMKAVNQSIGRAIRHAGDYAAILLVDARYCSSAPQEKLPGWIKERLVSVNGGFGQVQRLLHKFFKFNKDRNCI